MGVKIISQPDVEPITLANLRLHLGIEPYDVDSSGTGTHPHDDMIMAMLTAARQWAEDFTGRSIALKTLELSLDEFPDDEDIELPRLPVVSITSVKYMDGDIAEQTLDPSMYAMDNEQETEHWLVPAYGEDWPVTGEVVNAVRVRYRAGYQVPEPDSSAEDAQDLPGAIRMALLVLVDHFYANRGAVSERVPNEMPFAVQALLRPYRVNLGMA